MLAAHECELYGEEMYNGLSSRKGPKILSKLYILQTIVDEKPQNSFFLFVKDVHRPISVTILVMQTCICSYMYMS